MKYNLNFYLIDLFIFKIHQKADSQRDIIKTGLKLIEDLTRENGKDCIRFVPKTIESRLIIKVMK